MKINFLPIITFSLFLVAFICNSQTLTVNPQQLAFGNVFVTNTDSLPLVISNPTSQDITVTNIRFYNTYGIPAFSTLNHWFNIASGDSVIIYIRFSPRHNILHNSEIVIENNSHRGYVTVDLNGQGKFTNPYYDITENKTEELLKTAIRQLTGNGFISLGYNPGRDSMFMSLDNKKTNGQGAVQNTLECIYTGREAVGYTSRTDCQNNFSFNTEHTFPQSFFSSLEPMKSDLFHLFPTDDLANNQRGDHPFGIVTNPTWSSGGSKSDGTLFEPRDSQKGITARAMFYFVLRYQNYSNFLNTQENILRSWHIQFPPGQVEKTRNEDVFALQNNRNPFIDFPVLSERITSFSSVSSAPFTPTIELPIDTIVFGTIPTGTPVIFSYVIVNTGNQFIALSGFNLTHTNELSFESGGSDTMIAPGESHTVRIRCFLTVTDSIRAFLHYNSTAAGNNSVTVPIFVNDLVFTGIENHQSEFTISPNPASKFLSINPALNIPFNWSIFDLSGKKILESAGSSRQASVDVSGLCHGIYILHVVSERGTFFKRIIISGGNDR